MIIPIGSHKRVDNGTTVSNQQNNNSNKEVHNIITYNNLLNNDNIVGGHGRSNNSIYKDVHLLHNLLNNPIDKNEKAITNHNAVELNKNNLIKVRNSNIQIDRTESIEDNMSEPDFKNTLTPTAIKKIDNYQSKLNKYDDLAIPRLIRVHEHKYLRHIQNNKFGYDNKHILDYKTNLFTNRLFYNISSKTLTRHEEHLLALGLKFTLDTHQTTDKDLLKCMDEYHKRLCMRYDTVNMLKYTTEEPNLETKRIKEYVKHLQQKVKELYKQVELNELINETPQRHQVNKCYNPMDNIIINEYIKTCTSRMVEMLKTQPVKYFKTKQRKILRAIHNLQKDPTIIIKPGDKD